MPKSKQQKQSDLDELTGKLKSAKSVVMAEYRGTTVKNMDTFRRTMEKEGVFTKVYKMTLVRKALEANGISSAGVNYKTPVILSISEEDEVVPARLVKTAAKDIKTLSILSGVLDGNVVAKASVEALAELPSKDQLRAQLVGTINAPVSGFVNVLAGNLRGLVQVLNAISQKA